MTIRRISLACVSVLYVVAACGGTGTESGELPSLAQSQQMLGAVSRTYTTSGDFDLGTSVGVNHGVAGQLQLNTQSEVEPFMYVAHTSEGLLLKLDTRTGRQVARYFTTRLADCPTCSTANQWYPSRTAVDLNGNVWVANRAFNVQGSVTKIAGNLADCVDRNANGTIETSRDANDDGVIDTSDPAEFFGQGDECLVRSIPVGPVSAILRALALDENGRLWVGGYATHRVYEVDPVVGAVVRDFDLGTTPYGFVRKGKYLYSAALGQPVARVDVTVEPPTIKHMTATGNYGIAVDRSGIAWFGSTGGGIRRCDFESAATACDSFAGATHSGITVDADGQIWAASYDNGLVSKYASDGMLLGTSSCPGQNPYGVAVGHDGAIWSSAFYSALRVERGPLGGAPGACQVFSTAHAGGTLAYNYTYSDFTGFQLRNVTVQQGTWTVVQDGSANGTPWGTLRWNNEPEGAAPTGTLIKAEVRAADEPAQLESLAYVEVQNGVSFREQNVLGRYVEVRMTLRNLDTSKQQTPVLSDVSVEPANRAPVAACQSALVCADAQSCVAPANIDAGSTDPDGDPLTLSQLPAAPYSIGSTQVVLSVSDGALTATCSAAVTVQDCTAPTIQCPPQAIAECTANGSATVTPSAATATDACSTPVVQGPPTADFALGSTSVSYTAADAAGNRSECTSTIVVVDSTPPAIVCPGPLTAECSNGQAYVTPGMANASDVCGAPMVTGPAAGSFPLGTTAVAYQAVDPSGNVATCGSAIHVVDTVAPAVATNGAGALWPPNQKYISVSLADCGIAVQDACTGTLDPTTVSARITCVTSDEPDDAEGDGKTINDMILDSPTTVRLRAERTGTGDGRAYSILFAVQDAAGNVGNGTCRVNVPHDEGAPVVDSGEQHRVCR